MAMDTFTPFICALAFIVGYILYALIVRGAKQPNLESIPTVGPSRFPFSYIGAIRFWFDAKNIIQEGYDKFKGGSFKFAQTDRWVVVLCETSLIEELSRAPEDHLSLNATLNDILQVRFTLGSETTSKLNTIPPVVSQFNRHLTAVFPEVLDEIVAAFHDFIPVEGNEEWTKLPALESALKIVTRVNNRVFVGVPLCRDNDFIDLNIQFATAVMKTAAIVNLFPPFLKPLAGRLFSNAPASIERGMKHLESIIGERLNKQGEPKENISMPNDLISQLIYHTDPQQRTLRSLTQLMLVLNFVAIHTTSFTFAQALFNLLAHPEIIPQLREEVDTTIDREGWTKASIGKMRKVDSFLRESQRLSGLDVLSMSRKALKPFTFSDGTHIPPGVTVSAASRSLHHDEEIYPNAEAFDPFRFSDKSDEEGGSMYQTVTTAANYISFGHGRHACPGRFLAANELKTMLAHILKNYDLKLENEGERPEDIWYSSTCVPNLEAKILFRARQT